MSSPIRLKESILREAEAEARIFARSVPKQIEFWAEIGKTIASSVTNNDLLALLNGIAEVRIELKHTAAIDSNQIFAAVDSQSKDGSLAQKINSASVYYEASKLNPGLLDCVQEDGSRVSGYFQNGQFTEK